MHYFGSHKCKCSPFGRGICICASSHADHAVIPSTNLATEAPGHLSAAVPEGLGFWVFFFFSFEEAVILFPSNQTHLEYLTKITGAFSLKPSNAFN